MQADAAAAVTSLHFHLTSFLLTRSISGFQKCLMRSILHWASVL